MLDGLLNCKALKNAETQSGRLIDAIEDPHSLWATCSSLTTGDTDTNVNRLICEEAFIRSNDGVTIPRELLKGNGMLRWAVCKAFDSNLSGYPHLFSRIDLLHIVSMKFRQDALLKIANTGHDQLIEGLDISRQMNDKFWASKRLPRAVGKVN